MRVHFLFLLRVINDIKEHVLRTRTWTRLSVTRTRACGTRTRASVTRTRASVTRTRASVTRTRACGTRTRASVTRTREYLSAVCCVSSNFRKPTEATQIFALFNIDKSLSRNCQGYLNNYLALVQS